MWEHRHWQAIAACFVYIAPSAAELRGSSRFLMLAATALVFASACELAPVDEPGALSLRQEVADWQLDSGLKPDKAPSDARGSAVRADARPTDASVVDALQAEALAHRVSVDAAQVPVSSLLFLLTREADLDLVLLSELDQAVTYRAADQPLSEVLDALATQVPFDWLVDGRSLRVRDHALYSESYAIDYIDMQRSTRSRVGLATRVGTLSSSATSSDGSAVANGSETLIENHSDHRFWESLADDLEGLLQASVESAARFSLNQEAGLVTLHAGPTLHRRVRRYLDRMHDSVGRQVLIEASVVEVTLSDSYETGIDWQLLANGLNGFSAAQILGALPVVDADSVGRLPAPSALFSVVQKTEYGDVSATLSLLEQFGDVRILSRPRIIAMNNQASVLKVVDNRVYFTVNVERRSTDDRDEIVTESEIHTVPVGLVMNVTPQIGRDDQVMLNVRPTLSRILGFVDDPNPELALANVSNGVPEIQVRELESMLTVKSGNVAIIGGLMQDATRNRDRGVAGLARLPLIGPLFSYRTRAQERSELLIVLKPTVLSRVSSSEFVR